MSIEEEDRPTISRRIVSDPEPGSPGRAGVGVAYDTGAAKGNRFRIEQLWPPVGDEETGRAEPVYVDDENVIDLVQAILEHYQWEVVEEVDA